MFESMKERKVKMNKDKLKKYKGVFAIIILIALIVGAQLVTDNFTGNYNQKGFNRLEQYMKNRYIPEIYDCDNMAKDCEAFFESIGIDTYVIFGYKANYTEGHAWLILNFDSDTSMEFECTRFKFKENLKNYDFWYKTQGWIKGNETYDNCVEEILEYNDISTQFRMDR